MSAVLLMMMMMVEFSSSQESQVWESPPWSTVCSSQISTRTESCSTLKVRLISGCCRFSLLYNNLITISVLAERITQTVEITKHTVDIEEKGVKLKLTIVDTPGFGDAVNNTEWYVKGLVISVDPRYLVCFQKLNAILPWCINAVVVRLFLICVQLEVGGRLHRPAVRAVLQRRERTEPQEHPGQPRALLPLLHLALRSRVRAPSAGH